MGFNQFNSNQQPQMPVTKPFNNSSFSNNNFNNNSLGGRRSIDDIKQEMLDTTKPELRKSYISKYHHDDSNSDSLPVSNDQDSTTMQRNAIENMRNLSRGL